MRRTNFLYNTLKVPNVCSCALHEHYCVLSAHAFLSLRDRWQRLQDTKLAAKLFFFPTVDRSPLTGEPGAPGADKAACCLAGRLLWVLPSLPVLFIQFSSLLLRHWACLDASCLCVCCFVYFLCSCSVLLSLGSRSSSLPRLSPGKKTELKAI